MADLRTSVGRLHLRNPMVLASGILDETGHSMLRVAKSGAGAIVTKSIGREPRSGYPNPTVVEIEGGLLNAVGLPNSGIENYSEEMEIALEGGIPVIGSIFSGDAQGFAYIARRMQEYGAHALELNLSCPHAKGLGTEIGSSKENVAEIAAAVKDEVTIPVFVKLTPNVADIASLAEAVEESGGDGVTAINTVKAMSIVPEVRKPLLGNKVGGLSGPAIKPIGVRCVYEIYERVKIPIMGVGGVTTGMDAIEYIMAGARAVQIATAVRYRGIEVFQLVCDEIAEFMERNGYKRIEEMVGVAHE